MNYEAALESLLFLSPKPLSIKQLANILEISTEETKVAMRHLFERKNQETSGIHILEQDGVYQLVTNPVHAEILKKLSKDEVGELTRPSLETLTVIAYRGPITRPELEAIRGVQCALILRNLLMRGLIEEKDDSSRGEAVYTLSLDALRYLGVHALTELPDYQAFHGDGRMTKILDALEESETTV